MKSQILALLVFVLAACSSKPPPEVALRGKLPEDKNKNHFRIGQTKEEVQANVANLGNCTGSKELEVCEVRNGIEVRHLTFENRKLVRWDEAIESNNYTVPVQSSTMYNNSYNTAKPPNNVPVIKPPQPPSR